MVDGLVRLEAIQEDPRIRSCHCTAKLKLVAHPVGKLPHVPWEATNQAAVHLWYEDVFGFSVPALHSSEEAVGTWPETATSVAVRLLSTDEISIVAPCGLTDLFNMVVRRNPRRVTREQFVQRLHSKQILRKWPRVQVLYDE
jgi:uncharacterized protein